MESLLKFDSILRTRIVAIALALAPAVAIAQPMASPAESANATPLVVGLSSYEFKPDQITLVRGTTYRLHLTNTSGKSHNFSAPQLFAASSIASADRAKVEDGEIEVDGGQTVDVVFVPMTPGEYDIRCTHFLHSAFGMHAKVIVR